MAGPTDRARPDQPETAPGAARKPARFTLKGEATFYSAGWTAMRLPRGTCINLRRRWLIERTVTDYGPAGPRPCRRPVQARLLPDLRLSSRGAA